MDFSICRSKLRRNAFVSAINNDVTMTDWQCRHASAAVRLRYYVYAALCRDESRASLSKGWGGEGRELSAGVVVGDAGPSSAIGCGCKV